MANESEHIGGISISAEVVDGGVDAQLAALEAKLAKSAARGSKILSYQATVSGSDANSTSAKSGTSGTAQKWDTSKLEAKIDSLIAALGNLRSVASPTAPGRASGVSSAAQNVLVTDSPAKKSYDRQERRRDQTKQREDTKEEFEPSRKRMPDRSEGTVANAGQWHTFDPAVYAQQDRLAEAKAARQREVALNANINRKEAPLTSGETQLVTALAAVTKPKTKAAQRAEAAQRSEALGPYPMSLAAMVGPNLPPTATSVATRGRAGANETGAQQRAREEAAAMRATGGKTEADIRADAVAGLDRKGSGQRSFAAYNRSRTTLDADENQRRAEEQQTRQAANTVTTGRTFRTQISTQLGFFAGRGNERNRDLADLAAKNRTVADTERDINRGRQALDNPNSDLTAKQRKVIIKDITAAEKDLVKVQKERDVAQAKVDKYSTGGAALRSLAVIGLGGAAFSMGMKAVDAAIGVASKAAEPYFDAFTGYAQKTADLTSALADQARQTQGNAKGVVALSLAQAGFGDSTAATLQPILQQRAQVEAGNKALVQQIEMFREVQNLSGQSSLAGIGGGGTGGILGTSILGIPSTQEQTGNFLQRLGDKNALTTNVGGVRAGPNYSKTFGGTDVWNEKGVQAFARGIAFIDDQMEKGGDAADALSVDLSKTDARIELTAKAFDGWAPNMAKAIRDSGLYSQAIASSADSVAEAQRSMKAIDLAGTLTGPAEQLQAQRISQQNAANSVPAILSQQTYAQTAQQNQIQRTYQRQIEQINPAQAALSNLAAPPTAVGTGIALGKNDAQSAGEVAAKLKEAQAAQNTLNAYYERGKAVLLDTVQVDASLVAAIQSTGREIATTQQGMSNRDAAYQTAQYNYQLFISRRTLGDISGLTGHAFGVPSTELGTLERANLLLGRQSQMLSFVISQKQINFNLAVAGFQVPGQTAAEQAANVAQAKVEASYAQKQLDIQKQMFGNQVQIVDIGNLRQGSDLLRQIGLMTQGRKVQLLDAADQQVLQRLQATQQNLMNDASAQFAKWTSMVAQADANIMQVELATGKAIDDVTKKAISAAWRVGSAFFLGMTGGFLGTSASGAGFSTAKPVAGNNSNPTKNAAGYLGTVSGATSMIVGEAGSETVAILRNPRGASGGVGGGGGGNTVIFNGAVVRKDSDIDELARKVMTLMGRDAAIRGLRGPN